MQGILAHTESSNSKIIYNCLLYPTENWKSNFKFPYTKFRNRIYQFILKRKNAITGLITDMFAMFDWVFFIICMREAPWENSKGKQKCRTVEKLFIIRSVYCFKLMTVRNLLHSFQTDESSCFYTCTCFDEKVTLIFYKRIRIELIVYLLRLYYFFTIPDLLATQQWER